MNNGTEDKKSFQERFAAYIKKHPIPFADRININYQWWKANRPTIKKLDSVLRILNWHYSISFSDLVELIPTSKYIANEAELMAILDQLVLDGYTKCEKTGHGDTLNNIYTITWKGKILRRDWGYSWKRFKNWMISFTKIIWVVLNAVFLGYLGCLNYSINKENIKLNKANINLNQQNIELNKKNFSLTQEKMYRDSLSSNKPVLPTHIIVDSVKNPG